MKSPHPNPDNSARLFVAARNGNKAAWNELYEQTAPRLLAWAFSLTKNKAEAEDLVQETYLAAFLAADTFNQKSRLLTWLFGIALRRQRDKSRTRLPQTVPLCEEITPASASPFEADVSLHVSYRKALADLPDKLRDAFVLVAEYGFTHRESAHILRVPEGTVKWRVARAARRLRLDLVDFAPIERPVPVFVPKENSL